MGHTNSFNCTRYSFPDNKFSLKETPTSIEIMDSYGSGPARGCYNCGDASHQARDCPTRGPAKCYNCGGEGHMSRECPDGPKDKTCYKCGQPGHISRDCQNPAAEGAGRGGGGFQYGGGQGGQTCYSCGGYGHMSRDCTQGQKCYNCGEVGHLSRDCPVENNNERTCYKCKQPGHVQAQCPN